MTAPRRHTPSGPYVTDACAVCGMPGLLCERLDSQTCPGAPAADSSSEPERIWRITRDLSAG